MTTKCFFALCSVALVTLPVLGQGTLTTSRGDDAEVVQKQDAGKSELKTLYVGVAVCRRCHADPKDVQGEPPILCRCTEIKYWERDRHKEAFNVLLADQAKAIGRALGIPDVAKHPECLTCHGVFFRDPTTRDAGFRLEEGVSCVVCHGPHRNWYYLHGSDVVSDRLDWRKKSREEKEKDYGMTDLWDPAKRANLCLSCHLGNAAEGKVVTHAMYAAGHPPLPGFEPAAFSNRMPRHWQYIKEKRAEVKKLLQFSEEAAQFEPSRLAVLGGLVELRDTMALLAAQTAAPNWPELAQFDCYACHHDLKVQSWRQKRGYTGKPGRPALRRWPAELARLGVRHAGGDEKELRARLEAVYHACDAQPFGNPAEIRERAQDVVKYLNSLMAQFAKKPFDRAACLRCFHDLCTLAAEQVPDYDSARQITWALGILYQDLTNTRPQESTDAAVRTLWQDLDTQLRLEPPPGTEKQLPAFLDRLNLYDPFRFQETLEDLRGHLPRP
jgi:hypothetical protein